MSDRRTLSTLASRAWVPLLAGVVAGLVAGYLVIATLTWRDGPPQSHDLDPGQVDAAMAEMRRGGIGHVDVPNGTKITMGLGRRPGIADPADHRWFWQRVEGLGPDVCRITALGLLARADLVSLWIGPVVIRSETAIPTACANHDTLSRVMSFGETL